ncbi:MAG: FCD domain-containing protein [Actinomycetaceae bacterium]|nr:FCD domain-containing protein [Actinomycetaceae bacterium]
MLSAQTPQVPSGGALQRAIVEHLGRRIVLGELPPGTLLNMDDLTVELGVSRSVIREAVSVLASLGLVRSRKRKGTTVRDVSHWRALSPDIISWRLDDPNQRDDQFRSLIEFRVAVEPKAANLAAQRASEYAGDQLIELALQMQSAGVKGPTDLFLTLDTRFHNTILLLSENALFASMGIIVSETLAGRHRLGLMPPERPNIDAMQWHIDLARAIREGRSLDAQTVAFDIVKQSEQELYEVASRKPEPCVEA